MLRYGYKFRYGVNWFVRNCVLWIFLGLSSTAVAQDRVIIAFGDSLTQGFGLPADQGFVPQLQIWLTAQGQAIRVINAGVSGDTTAGGKARIDWTLAEPADAIIVALGGNDVLRGLPPDAAMANLDYILNAATSKGLRVLLVGTPAPGNYGPDYKAAFDAIYPTMAAKYDVPLYPSFFAAFAGQGNVPAELGDLVQADGLHPSAKGISQIVSHMGPHVIELFGD